MAEPLDFLKRLMSEPGISGYEENAQQIWRAYVEPYADSVQEHTHGALTASLRGELDASVMLIGHMDEIGMIVKHVEGSGFLKAAPVGGLPKHLLQSQRVQIVGRNGVVRGIVGVFQAPSPDPGLRSSLSTSALKTGRKRWSMWSRATRSSSAKGGSICRTDLPRRATLTTASAATLPLRYCADSPREPRRASPY